MSMSEGSAATLQSGDEWIEVFQQRSVWSLTRPAVDRWVQQNQAFFRMLRSFAEPGSSILELGCGPGRHALGAASLGYRVVGIDIEPRVVQQARLNAQASALAADFQIGDMNQLTGIAPKGFFQAITHGGLMEHFPSADAIRASLSEQLRYVPVVVFDVPVDSAKNRTLFERDNIFRQLWTAEQWIQDVLAGFDILEARTDLHPKTNMTDDLVVALRLGTPHSRSERGG